ncbi:uncharacterized protein METZ01_LOCUS3205 [marine metagenome]|uniref:Uncharacterized protein n=1 Tax=marine metagenome TaxID=408172 RepID=A0A381N6W3_9ZZZZ
MEFRLYHDPDSSCYIERDETLPPPASSIQFR